MAAYTYSEGKYKMYDYETETWKSLSLGFYENKNIEVSR